MKVGSGVLLLASMLTGCVTLPGGLPAPAPPPTRSSALPPAPPPSPTPSPAPTPPAPPAPPPRVLSPEVADEPRMRQEAQNRIEGTERLVRGIDQTKLVGEQQQQSFQTIQSFLAKAKEALSARDLQRAFTLADKAYLLAGELSRALSTR